MDPSRSPATPDDQMRQAEDDTGAQPDAGLLTVDFRAVDLGRLRSAVRDRSRGWGLAGPRLARFVLAVHEGARTPCSTAADGAGWSCGGERIACAAGSPTRARHPREMAPRWSSTTRRGDAATRAVADQLRVRSGKAQQRPHRHHLAAGPSDPGAVRRLATRAGLPARLAASGRRCVDRPSAH